MANCGRPACHKCPAPPRCAAGPKCPTCKQAPERQPRTKFELDQMRNKGMKVWVRKSS